MVVVVKIARVFLVLAVGSTALSTTIVGVSTSDSVFLGADSMVDVGGRIAKGRMCKIVAGDNAAAAMAGHLADSATGFNAARLIRRALNTSGPLAVKASAFEQIVRQPLQQSLDYGRNHVPLLFASKYAGKQVLQTIFASVEGGKPKMIASTIRANDSGSLLFDDLKELGSRQICVVGESAAIARYQITNPRWTEVDPAEIIRKLLALELKDKPTAVGTPLSIVRITSSERRWIEAGECFSQELAH
jgi:hypothetical protein